MAKPKTNKGSKELGHLKLPTINIVAMNKEQTGVFLQTITVSDNNNETIVVIRAMFNKDKTESICAEVFFNDTNHPAEYIFHDISNDGYVAAGLCVKLQTTISRFFCHNPSQYISNTLSNDIITAVGWVMILLTKGELPTGEYINTFNIREWRNPEWQ